MPEPTEDAEQATTDMNDTDTLLSGTRTTGLALGSTTSVGSGGSHHWGHEFQAFLDQSSATGWPPG